MTNPAKLDLSSLSAKLTTRELTASETIETCFRRIERLDPALNAFRHVDVERAREQAKVSDARNRRLGPLDGVPVAIKENVDIEGLITRNGLGPRDERPAKRDAVAVRRLREAGAIILGHTSMHEAALGATNDNPHCGRTHNPWRHGHTPGGSSGGSAAAVAARLCPLALGTDTMGSVRLPAAYCGVLGYKPSRGRIDNIGVAPLCRELDQVGPIARTVADLRLWYQAAVPMTSGATRIDLQALRAARLVNLESVDLCDWVRAAFDDVIKRLDQEGVAAPATTMRGFDGRRARLSGLLLIEVEAARYFQCDRERYPDAFSESFATLLDYGAAADESRIVEAKENLAEVRRSFDALFKDIDLLLMPTAPQAAFSFDDPVPSNQADLTVLANITGAPAVSLPMALDPNGLPIGLQVIGAPGADDQVLAAAAMLEAMIAFELPELPQGDPG